MVRYDRRLHLLAALLSVLAGFVDALGFVALGGFFVSFMSGNSTRLGVGLSGAWPAAGSAALLIGVFVLGVVVGALIGDAAKSVRCPVVLALIALLLASGALLHHFGTSPWIALVPVAAAMGAENTLFQRDGEVTIGLTYMTGNLVRMGQRIAAAIRGGDRYGWWPYFLLWASLVLGAVLGSIAFRSLDLAALWIAAAYAIALLAVTVVMEAKAHRS